MLAKALGYAAFSASLVGIVAWNTNNKCRAGTGIFHSLAKHCPEDRTVFVLVVGIAAAIFLGFLLWAKIASSRHVDRSTNEG
ncbi:hypothetical protein [Pseudoxanthomonas wuyuanensis]|nr:hypothetical protein [Pseudoxanthomonas wuyuanensis]